MAFVNNTMIVRRDLMSKLIKLHKEGNLVAEIDRLPILMSPKNAQARGRCCIHKERAVLKYKMLPILGFSVEDEEDELYVHGVNHGGSVGSSEPTEVPPLRTTRTKSPPPAVM